MAPEDVVFDTNGWPDPIDYQFGASEVIRYLQMRQAGSSDRDKLGVTMKMLFTAIREHFGKSTVAIAGDVLCCISRPTHCHLAVMAGSGYGSLLNELANPKTRSAKLRSRVNPTGAPASALETYVWLTQRLSQEDHGVIKFLAGITNDRGVFEDAMLPRLRNGGSRSRVQTHPVLIVNI